MFSLFCLRLRLYNTQMTMPERLSACLIACALITAAFLPLTAFASSVEEQVQAFFKDIPVMQEIAKCESGFRQFNADGTPLRGGWAGGMIGVFQFHERIHSAPARVLGYDLATLEGNLAYAKHLYETSGTQPWNSAKSCWGNAGIPTTIKEDSAQASLEELEKKIAQLQKLVVQLQELLAQKNALLVRR